jgi:hypothetical protein
MQRKFTASSQGAREEADILAGVSQDTARAGLSTTLRSPSRRTQIPATGLVRADQSYSRISPV